MQNKGSGGPRHDGVLDDSRRDSPAAGEWPWPPHRSAAGSHESQALKASAYEDCYGAIVAVWKDEGGNTLDDIALMSTINSVLSNRFTTYYWTGFYRVCGDRLVVGPYIGTVGCLQIQFGKGVCGTAAERRETLIAADVNQFPGHIACDAASKSEIVVPVFGPDGELIAVLDVDSAQLDAFDEEDRTGLERIVGLFRQT
jgi:GAF domain-containing protein